MSASQAVWIPIYGLVWLTPEEISFHGERAFPTWSSYCSSLQMQQALFTHICQRSVHQQWRRKFQEALPRQVSTLTIETTSVSPSSCQPSCKPAVAVPIKSAMWESWKGACRCAFLQALSLVAASNVSLTLSSVCINIGVIWTWREAVAI